MATSDRSRLRSALGFTLVELLVSTSLLLLLALMLVALTHETSRTLAFTTGKAEQFRGAREAFENLTHRLSQATLNTYWDYDYGTAVSNEPSRYARRSELRFICGPAGHDEFLGQPADPNRRRVGHGVFFQAPLGFSDNVRGLENLLNTWGYFVEYGNDDRYRPSVIPAAAAPERWRFRLLAFMPSAEENLIYHFTSGWVDPAALRKQPRSAEYREMGWFRDQCNAGDPPTHVVAENVIALILTPRLAAREEAQFPDHEAQPDFSPLAPDYVFDSSPAPSRLLSADDPRYADARLNPVAQLPPLIEVTMVAIDEPSAQRLNLARGDENCFGLVNDGKSGKFTQSAQLTADLRRDPSRPFGRSTGAHSSFDQGGPLENTLIGARVNYRIFSTRVALRGAKWSRAQGER